MTRSASLEMRSLAILPDIDPQAPVFLNVSQNYPWSSALGDRSSARAAAVNFVAIVRNTLMLANLNHDDSTWFPKRYYDSKTRTKILPR